MLEDLTAGDVGDEGFSASENVKLFFAEEMNGFFGQWDGDEEMVDILREEVMKGRFIRSAIPGAGDGAIRVPGTGNDEAMIFLALGRGPGRSGVGNDIRTHGLKNPRCLPSDASVPEDAEALTDVITDLVQATLLACLIPVVGLLQVVQLVVLVRMDEGGHENPFRDLWAVNARRSRQGDVGVGVDGMVGDMICAG